MALDPLFTVDDVEARLGRTLTVDETARADALIADVSAAVRFRTRQQLTEATSTDVRLRVRRGRIRLPQRPVTAVTAVTDIAGNPLMFTWLGDDVVQVQTNLDAFSCVPWRNGIAAVDVTYTHGYADDELPDVLVGVCCSIFARAIGRDPRDAGVTTEQVAGYSYTLGSAGAAGAFGLLPDERTILDSFRRPAGFVQIGPT